MEERREKDGWIYKMDGSEVKEGKNKGWRLSHISRHFV